jgi:acyl dehydratase
MAPAEAPSGAPPSTPHVTTVCFTTQDLAQFSAASGDRNPLHLSEEYARATPYGEPVVFGMLGVLAALGHLADRQDRLLQRLSVEFRNPLVRRHALSPGGARNLGRTGVRQTL